MVPVTFCWLYFMYLIIFDPHIIERVTIKHVLIIYLRFSSSAMQLRCALKSRGKSSFIRYLARFFCNTAVFGSIYGFSPVVQDYVDYITIISAPCNMINRNTYTHISLTN